MSTQTVKIAVSMPKGMFRVLEDVRRKLSISRSALVDEAVRYWLESKKKQQLIKKYEKGYVEKPEEISRIKKLQDVQFESLNKEGWK